GGPPRAAAGPAGHLAAGVPGRGLRDHRGQRGRQVDAAADDPRYAAGARRIYAMMPQFLATGLTVLLVEQDVSQALRVASRVHCLLEGRTTLEGQPSELTPERVEAAYFGLGEPAPASTDSGGGNGGQPVPSAGQES